MRCLLNALYLFGSSPPFALARVPGSTRANTGAGCGRKLTGQAMLRDGEAPCAWFHGVSVGEIHLLRQVVGRFRQRHPDWECVVSTTTDTGYSTKPASASRTCLSFSGPSISPGRSSAPAAGQPDPDRPGRRRAVAEFPCRGQKTRGPGGGRQRPHEPAQPPALSPPRLSGHGPFSAVSISLAVQTEEYAGAFRELGVDPRTASTSPARSSMTERETDRHNPGPRNCVRC